MEAAPNKRSYVRFAVIRGLLKGYSRAQVSVEDLLVPVLEDPSKAGEQHWTGVKIHGWLKEQLAMELGYRTTIRYLHELDYNLRVPQRWPERQNEAERAAFLEELHTLRQ